MRRLSLTDTGFLLTEKRETPMHVAGLHLFTLPEDADEHEFLHSLADSLRATDEFQPPFGDRLKVGPLGLLGPVHWEADKSLDIDYHVRHAALPQPGRYRELFALVSRLHSQLMDRDRPLWTIHLIEGLQNRQFAIYMKFHHAAIDGVRGIHLTQSMYSADPEERMRYSPLSVQAAETYQKGLGLGLATSEEPPTERQLANVAEVVKAGFDSSVHILGALRRVAGAWTDPASPLMVPWRRVPHSPINTKVDGARRFVAQSWPFARIRAVGKALDGTFNDAVLAMCSGALRRYLTDAGGLPTESLKAMVPISLRRPDDLESSNAVGAISADLATNLRDPIRRFSSIQASMQAGKQMFQELSPVEAQLVMQVFQMPLLFLDSLGLTARFPPYSTVISNVPGPRQQLYWNGAKLEGIYPASIVLDGFALNITLVSVADHVDFGITACRRTLPQIQRFIDHLEDALVELEEATGLTGATDRPATRKSRSAAGKPAKKKKKTSASSRKSTKKKTRSGAGKSTKKRGRSSTKKAAKKKTRSSARKVAKKKARSSGKKVAKKKTRGSAKKVAKKKARTSGKKPVRKKARRKTAAKKGRRS
ncbi:MAG: wax ester/triacylglycerol synthase family O-acyltransferase [Gammaproteobacteria bacterium]